MAAELNKTAKWIDEARKKEKRAVLAQIEPFEAQMIELRDMCRTGHANITGQVKVFDDERLNQCATLLYERRNALFEELSVGDAFVAAEYDDLIKLGSLTAGGKLTKGADDELLRRVQADKSAQDRDERRRLWVENESYRAGLSAPIAEVHYNAYLRDADSVFEAAVIKALDAETDREAEADKRRQLAVAREATAKAARERETAERAQRAADAAEAEKAHAAEPAPETAQAPEPAPAAPAPKQTAPKQAAGASSERVRRRVEVQIDVSIPSAITDEQLGVKVRAMLIGGGFKEQSVTAVEVIHV
jgi:hypothetical protein